VCVCAYVVYVKVCGVSAYIVCILYIVV
jgi:hypothetical protein